MEIISLSSDEIAHSSPVAPIWNDHNDTVIDTQYELEKKDKGKGKGIRAIASQNDDSSLNECSGGTSSDEVQPMPTVVGQYGYIDPPGLLCNVSYYKDTSMNRMVTERELARDWESSKMDRGQTGSLKAVGDIIVIEDTPVKHRPPSALSSDGRVTDRDTGFSTTTASILAGVLEKKSSPEDEVDGLCASLKHKSSRRRRSTDHDDGIQNLDGLRKTKKKKTISDGIVSPEFLLKGKKSKKTEEERDKQRKEKAQKAAKNKAEKEARQLEKEAKALEKQKEQELDTVNKLKTSKKDSVKEMIVDISTHFAESLSGQQLLRFLETQGCEITVDWEPPIQNIIKWRRKVAANWDHNMGYFVPIPQEIRDEQHLLVVVKADEFVDLAIMETGLDDHVTKIKALWPRDGIKVIYVIEGLVALLRKSRNAKNRSFQGAVRQAIGAGASTEDSSRGYSRAATNRSGKGPKVVDEDAIEDALLSLQITHGCLIHHTVSMQETSEWISVFTGDISTIPYKTARMNYDTSFCADVGQVKTGNDIEDTYFKMLQEINRVTAGVANGVMGEYKTVRELVNACKTEGEAVVADVEIMASKTGISSGRRIGHATSKRIQRFFTGQDPDCVDI